MTISTTTSAVSYTATGSDAVYPYTWSIAQASDLIVYKMTPAGVITLLVLTTDYTVSGAGIPTGGNVTLVAGNLTAGYKLFIASDPLEIQALLLQQGAGFNPADIMNALDLLTREVQAVRRVADNSLRFPLVESLAGLISLLPPAVLRASGFPAFDASGNLIVAAGVNTGVPISTFAATLLDDTSAAAMRATLGAVSATVATIAALKALATTDLAGTVEVLGYYAANDGGGGFFRYNSGDASSDNGGTIIAPTAGSGRWNRIYYESLNVRWFGAKGDNSTIDDVAMQAALTAVPTAGGVVYVPRGTYLVSLQLTCNNRAITLRGDGMGVSNIRWDSTATTYGLSFTNDDDDQHVEVNELSLITEKLALGTAVLNTRTAEAVASLVQDRTTPRFCMTNVDIKGSGDNKVNGWLYGVRLVDCIHSNFVGVHFSGYDNNVAATPLSEAAFSFAGVNGPTEVSMESCWAFYAKSAVRVRETVEGVFIVNSTFVAVKYGVDWNTTAGRPQLALDNSHVSAYIDGVNGINLTQCSITGNLFYERDDAIVDGTGITLTDGRYNVIQGNTFLKLAGGGIVYKGVYLGGTTDFSTITGNMFQNANYGIDMASGTANNRHSGNSWGSVAVRVRDSSVSNFKPVGYQTIVYNSGNVSIPDTVLTAMTWDTIAIDEIGAANIGSHPTTLVIPAGVEYVDIDGAIFWGVDATAQRRTELFINGIAGSYVPKVHQTASANNASCLSIKQVPVTAGDILSLRVEQTTGGAINVNNDVATFFKITVSQRDD